ncbi:MAG: MBL fold metallo-hydrolase [Candidatus Cloacimonetes bacterium]|nr:MBL fold metallo-hydrolase [Candidatus Cloacimonadota bacterium]
MFLRLVIVFFVVLLVISCGTDKVLKPIVEQPSSGIIQDLTLVNNELKFNTIDSAYVYLIYKNRLNQNETFKAWSAGNPTKIHNYKLPVNLINNVYQMQLSVYGSESFQDTVFTFTSAYNSNSFLRVHLIDVAQGDAILIQTPDNKNIQIDGGYGTRGSSDWQGGGLALALMYLQDNEITYLDYIIETHRHGDHYGGLLDIIANNIDYNLYISPTQPQGYYPGMNLNIDSVVDFTFFSIGYPPNYNEDNINNTSIVLKAVYGDAEFLFTGDAEGVVQDYLINADYDLSCDVLKVSHHGSASNNTSNSAFLSKVLDQYAKIALLSFGTNNPYNHPHSISRFSNYETYGTGIPTSYPSGSNYNFDSGDILLISDGRLIFVTTEK